MFCSSNTLFVTGLSVSLTSLGQCVCVCVSVCVCECGEEAQKPAQGSRVLPWNAIWSILYEARGGSSSLSLLLSLSLSLSLSPPLSQLSPLLSRPSLPLYTPLSRPSLGLSVFPSIISVSQSSLYDSKLCLTLCLCLKMKRKCESMFMES